jgi:hypothetical protein
MLYLKRCLIYSSIKNAQSLVKHITFYWTHAVITHSITNNTLFRTGHRRYLSIHKMQTAPRCDLPGPSRNLVKVADEKGQNHITLEAVTRHKFLFQWLYAALRRCYFVVWPRGTFVHACCLVLSCTLSLPDALVPLGIVHVILGDALLCCNCPSPCRSQTASRCDPSLSLQKSWRSIDVRGELAEQKRRIVLHENRAESQAVSSVTKSNLSLVQTCDLYYRLAPKVGCWKIVVRNMLSDIGILHHQWHP